jgi:hypothetical protein
MSAEKSLLFLLRLLTQCGSSLEPEEIQFAVSLRPFLRQVLLRLEKKDF